MMRVSPDGGWRYAEASLDSQLSCGTGHYTVFHRNHLTAEWT